ncbi:MAG: hypothetical protein V4623_03895 [Pseudomonadota bacterium]
MRPAKLALTMLAFLSLLSACATRSGADGQSESYFNPRYLAKTDIDRVVDVNRAEVIAGLRRIAEKLYRRNPKEWKKSGQADLNSALERLFGKAEQTLAVSPETLDFPELEGRREGQAALYAFDARYQGDRVLALMAGLLGMSYAAFEHKADFYVLDHLDAQKLANCAHNFEIAVWKLSSSKNPQNGARHEALLLSNALDPEQPNLSIEREFGRIVGLLDFLAKVVADKNGRSITRLSQSVVTAVFLPVSALGLR